MSTTTPNGTMPKRPPPAIATPGRAGPPVTPAQAAAGVPNVTAGRMSLANRSTGLIDDPLLRIVVYGVEGVGKSMFGANSPGPIFLGAEDGSGELDVERFPRPHTWADALEAIEVLRTTTHEHETLVVDSLDWLEPMVWAHTCEKWGKPTIESFGYGKGYGEALTEWRAFFAALERLQRERKMSLILLAHAVVGTFKNPDANQGDFDHYTLKLHKGAAGLAKEWAKALLFGNYELATVEKDGRTRGMSTGKRVLYTQKRAAYDAKNRLLLPPEIKLSWGAFMRAVREGREVRTELAAALAAVPRETREVMQEWLEDRNFALDAVREGIAALRAKAATPQTTPTTPNTTEPTTTTAKEATTI